MFTEEKTGTIKTKLLKQLVTIISLITIALCSQALATTKHIEQITAAPGTYQVKMGGTLDEFNTANYLETYGNNIRLKSRYLPNEYLVLENIGDTDVINPRIVINGRRNWYSADDILSNLIKPDMTMPEKAKAIWSFTSNVDLHTHENDRRVDNGEISLNTELTNPVKWANCYYCSGCQFASAVFVVLCQKMGLPPEHTRTVGMGSAHRIAEIFYDNDWHVLDGDERMFHLEKDNKTLASFDDIRNNPELCNRSHGGGFASKGLRKRGRQYQNNEPIIKEIKDIKPYLSTMAMTLRPGEKFIWRWDHIGKYRCGDNKRNIKPSRPKGLLPYQLANGKMIYQPRLNTEQLNHAPNEISNIVSVTKDNQPPKLIPKSKSDSAYVVYKISSPYPIVGGRISAEFLRKTTSDICKIYVSVRDSWTEVWSAKKTGLCEEYIDIDDVLDPIPTPAIYNYQVKFELKAQTKPEDVTINQITIESDVQMSGTALPSLSVGDNSVVYKDESKSRKVRITHAWNENSMIKPPLAPTAPASPADGAQAFLKKLKLSWKPAQDPDGHITDYHIQVSPRPDMLYPVSPNFDRITFSSEPRWKVPKNWLLHNQTYYWRVRSRDNWGVWSNWSNIWSFTTAPPPPK